VRAQPLRACSPFEHDHDCSRQDQGLRKPVGIRDDGSAPQDRVPRIETGELHTGNRMPMKNAISGRNPTTPAGNASSPSVMGQSILESVIFSLLAVKVRLASCF
jgi:hypothetical protein